MSPEPSAVHAPVRAKGSFDRGGDRSPPRPYLARSMHAKASCELGPAAVAGLTSLTRAEPSRASAARSAARDDDRLARPTSARVATNAMPSPAPVGVSGARGPSPAPTRRERPAGGAGARRHKRARSWQKTLYWQALTWDPRVDRSRPIDVSWSQDCTRGGRVGTPSIPAYAASRHHSDLSPLTYAHPLRSRAGRTARRCDRHRPGRRRLGSRAARRRPCATTRRVGSADVALAMPIPVARRGARNRSRLAERRLRARSRARHGSSGGRIRPISAGRRPAYGPAPRGDVHGPTRCPKRTERDSGAWIGLARSPRRPAWDDRTSG